MEFKVLVAKCDALNVRTRCFTVKHAIEVFSGKESDWFGFIPTFLLKYNRL